MPLPAGGLAELYGVVEKPMSPVVSLEMVIVSRGAGTLRDQRQAGSQVALVTTEAVTPKFCPLMYDAKPFSVYESLALLTGMVTAAFSAHLKLE